MRKESYWSKSGKARHQAAAGRQEYGISRRPKKMPVQKPPAPPPGPGTMGQ